MGCEIALRICGGVANAFREANPTGITCQPRCAIGGSKTTWTVGLNRGVRRLIALDHATWEKLVQLADTATQTTSQRVTASQVAAAIIEQFVAALPQQGKTQE